MKKDQARMARRQVATIECYKRVFGGDDGKKILRDLMKQFHFLSPVFDKDPYVHAFKSGELNAVKFILTKMHMKLDDVYKFLEEAEHERSSDSSKYRGISSDATI